MRQSNKASLRRALRAGERLSLRRRSMTGLMIATGLSIALFALDIIPDSVFTSAGSSTRPMANSPVQARASGTVGEVFQGNVTRIVDGDTFWTDAADVRIRIWGLDAPELGAPGGDAATEALRRIVGNAPVTCLTRDIDRWGRIVGQCFSANGEDITRQMIEGGTSTEFCRFSRNHYGTC